MTLRTSLSSLLKQPLAVRASERLTPRCCFTTTPTADLTSTPQPPPPPPSKQKTALYDFHVRNGAKMVDFAGWLMPVQYADLSVQASHAHTRAHCSLFDVSHMLQTRVHGADRFRFIERLVVGDIAQLAPDTGALTLFTNERGGIVDDLIVCSTSLGHLYVVSNAGCAHKDYAHMRAACDAMRARRMDVELVRVDDRALLALQGPATAALLARGVPRRFELARLPFMGTRETSVFGVEDCRVTRCGYTGEDGVEISVPVAYAQELAERLIHGADDAAAAGVCKLAGLGARDTLRLEAGLCLYGNDIDDTTTPVEAGLAWTIGKRRRVERDFPGAETILRQLKEKPAVKRVGLKLLASGGASGANGPSARQHMKVFSAAGSGKDDSVEEIGEITSGSPSPTLKQNIAMAYVKAAFAKADTRVLVEIRKKKYEAEIVKMPFVPTKYYQMPH